VIDGCGGEACFVALASRLFFDLSFFFFFSFDVFLAILYPLASILALFQLPLYLPCVPSWSSYQTNPGTVSSPGAGQE